MKEKMKLSGTALKYIAILAMTIDHTAYMFVNSETPLYYCMRMIGRLTAPIMSFLLVEGFCHTKNFKQYLMRMMLFAVITQPFYFLMLYGRPPIHPLEFFMTLNVMTTFSISLILLKVKSENLSVRKKLILTAVCIAFVDLCDWSYIIPVWVRVFYRFRNENDKRKRTLVFIGVSVLLLIVRYLPLYDSFADFSYQLGVLLALIPLHFYSGERGGRMRNRLISRYGFYAYYPLHMVVLILIWFVIKSCYM